MNTLTFLNQPLLWGLAAASIPILIHLLYRRQYRRVDWAPMKYLKLSIQRNRRRVRIEQLLLLLLRTVLVMLLFFLVARPVIQAQGLARLLGTTSRTNRVVVIDDSLSMGYTVSGKSALARGQEVLADLLPSFGPQDHLTLVLASAPKTPLVREVDLDHPEDVLKIAREVQPSDVFAAWEPIVQAVDALISAGSYPLHDVTLITDLRRSGWDGAIGQVASRWAGERVEMRVFDVGSNDTANVALNAFVQTDRLALVGTPTRFEAEVHNDTGGELAGVEANFIVDGKPSLVRVPTLAAGQTIKLPLVAVLQEAGSHDVAFELPHDALPGDNRRAAVVQVQQSVDILLVDGEPSNEPLGGETDFLGLALSLAAEAAEAFHVEVVTDSEWSSSPTTHPDLLVLANVAHLSADQAESIKRQVSDGMGLMIFVGDQLDPDNYNQLFFEDGRGLLGAAFEGISDSEFAGLLIESAEGSPLDALGQLNPAALERIKVRKTYDMRMPPGEVEGLRVLARWNNQSGGPAIVQKMYGKGQTLLWTTAADRSWSDWPTEASYVLAVRETAKVIARSTASLHQFTAGDPLRVELPASHDISSPAIEIPGADETKPLILDNSAAAADTTKPISTAQAPAKAARVLNYADTRRAGLYKMTWRDSASGPGSELFAVNPDRRESDLTRLASPDFKQLFGALDVEVISIGSGSEPASAARGQEIWRMLATGLLGLLVVEACFARWAGRQR